MPELRGELRVESGRSSFLLAKIPAWCWVKLPGRFLLELQAQGFSLGRLDGDRDKVVLWPLFPVLRCPRQNRGIV